MSVVYVVDDDLSTLETLRQLLMEEGYSVRTTDRPEVFLERIEEEEPAVAVLDIFFGECSQDGEFLAKYLAEHHPNTQTIIMSGESDIKKVLSCLESGALDFLEKPVSIPRLLTSVRNALAVYNTRVSSQADHDILFRSIAMKAVIERLKKLASLNEAVLVCGESGTGKELIAENLHLYSRRYALPMYRVNCAALNPNLIESALFGHRKGSFTGADSDRKGYFEIAEGSSLFIDEIGDFPFELQSKILRVIQEREISPVGSPEQIPTDTRLIFATHRNLEEMVASGTFRDDLYFCISTFTIHVPPLRDRTEDIEVLAPHFLNRFLVENNMHMKILADDALVKLKEYNYPGNVRELAKIVKNAALFCDAEVIGSEDVSFSSLVEGEGFWVKCRSMSLAESRYHFERELILRRLKEFGNDMGKTAESLGIIKNNLYRKLRFLGINRDELP